MEAIFLLGNLWKNTERRNKIYMIFIDLEKAYNKISRDLTWWILDKRSPLRGYIDIIKDM